MNSKYTFVFDLDDTLYSERDFQKSGIIYVCNQLNFSEEITEKLINNPNSWIQNIFSIYNCKNTKTELLNLYRNHFPSISLFTDAKIFLNRLREKKIKMSLITDGRIITQKNKLKALGIENYFVDIIISEEINSEKPSEINFKSIMKYKENYIYIADNTQKDFVTPNKLGWETICLLDRGHNIHKQDFTLNSVFLPKHKVKSFDEINFLYEF
jgi:putative hydrolase of the HAD superfamily